MVLRCESSIGRRISPLGVLALSVWLLTGTPADGQATTAPATSAAAAKKTIQLAQDRLLALGYLFGTADGVMGEKTTAALKNFQSAHGLPVTGQLDRKTLAALDAPPPAPTVTTPAARVQKAQMLQGDWLGDFSGEQPFIYHLNGDGSGTLYWTRGSQDDTAGINYSLDGDQITAHFTYDSVYTATVKWNHMTGVLSQYGQSVPLILTNADSSARQSGSLRGDWLGTLPGNMPILVNFVHRRAEITNLIGTERFSYSVDGTQITITDPTTTFTATIDGDQMNGNWSSDGKSQPMTIVKAGTPAQ